MDLAELKSCSKCHRMLPKERFNKNKKSKSGLRSQCKDCVNSYGKQHYIGNKVKIDAQHKAYYNNNKETRNKKIAEWRKANPDKCRRYDKNHYYKFRKKRIAKTIRWLRLNKDRHAAQEQKRRDLKSNLPMTLTDDKWKQCLKYFNNTCAYCGNSYSLLEQDHVIPLTSGGGFTADNIIPACKSCNSSKGNRPLRAWYCEQPFYSIKREQTIQEYIHLIESEVKAV